MDRFLRLVDALDGAVRWAAIAACAAIAVVMGLQVFFRYVVNDSLQWSEEVAVWCMVWMVYLGAAAASKTGEHVTVTMAIDWLPPRAKAWAIMAAKAASFVFLGFLVWYGIQAFNATFHRVSPSTGLSSKWAKLALPVGGALMLIAGVASLLRDLAELRRGNLGHFRQQLSQGLG